METEAQPATPPRRPRTSLLVLLGIVIVAFALMTLGDSADQPPPTSNSARAPQQPQGGKLDPAQLDVRLEELKKPPPPPGDTERNPFRFRPKPPPPPPPVKDRDAPPVAPPPPPPDVGPPQPPPITLKFIGVTEAPGIGKIAALTDCRRTEQGREGETVYGRYRIVKIGAESLMIEYTDGKGRTTLRMTGQDCVAR
jgi:hypothetical protein